VGRAASACPSTVAGAVTRRISPDEAVRRAKPLVSSTIGFVHPTGTQRAVFSLGELPPDLLAAKFGRLGHRALLPHRDGVNAA
jgi:hypothetical protein